ncbi:protein of unknown function [Xenorhabdus poinarii G6]|uniref:Uncharacterized protein n=1 Tax=Xenorhabdus poinarii G6 TaxID=1354304 RepID=A0A068R5K2_9GAMM|nr:protein of unknown function [Xenorhabdus poinarii G6]
MGLTSNLRKILVIQYNISIKLKLNS